MPCRRGAGAVERMGMAGSLALGQLGQLGQGGLRLIQRHMELRGDLLGRRGRERPVRRTTALAAQDEMETSVFSPLVFGRSLGVPFGSPLSRLRLSSFPCSAHPAVPGFDVDVRVLLALLVPLFPKPSRPPSRTRPPSRRPPSRRRPAHSWSVAARCRIRGLPPYGDRPPRSTRGSAHQPEFSSTFGEP